MVQRQTEEDAFLKALNSLGEKWITLTEKNLPLIKRGQWMNFVIVLILVTGIIALTFFGKISESSATGLLGAIIGYVFGSLYSKEKK